MVGKYSEGGGPMTENRDQPQKAQEAQKDWPRKTPRTRKEVGLVFVILRS
jgi:hypothetical protein